MLSSVSTVYRLCGRVSQGWKIVRSGATEPDLLFRTYTTPHVSTLEKYTYLNSTDLLVEGTTKWEYSTINDSKAYSKWIYGDSIPIPSTATFATAKLVFHDKMFCNYSTTGEWGYNLADQDKVVNWEVNTIEQAIENSEQKKTQPKEVSGVKEYYTITRIGGKYGYVNWGTGLVLSSVYPVTNTEYRYALVYLSGRKNVYVQDNIVAGTHLDNLITALNGASSCYVTQELVSRAYGSPERYEVSETSYDFTQQHDKDWSTATRGKTDEGMGSALNLYDNLLIFPAYSTRKVYIKHIDIGTGVLIDTTKVNAGTRITPTSAQKYILVDDVKTTTNKTFSGYEEYYEGIGITQDVTKYALELDDVTYLGYNVGVAADRASAQSIVDSNVRQGTYKLNDRVIVDGKGLNSNDDAIVIEFYYSREPYPPPPPPPTGDEPEKEIPGNVFVESAENIVGRCVDTTDQYTITSIPSGTDAKVGIEKIPQYMAGAITLEEQQAKHTLRVDLTLKVGPHQSATNYTLNYEANYYNITNMLVYKFNGIKIYDANSGHSGTLGDSMFDWANGTLTDNKLIKSPTVKMSGINSKSISNTQTSIQDEANYIYVLLSESSKNYNVTGLDSKSISHTYLSLTEWNKVDINKDNDITEADKEYAAYLVNELKSDLDEATKVLEKIEAEIEAARLKYVAAEKDMLDAKDKLDKAAKAKDDAYNAFVKAYGVAPTNENVEAQKKVVDSYLAQMNSYQKSCQDKAEQVENYEKSCQDISKQVESYKKLCADRKEKLENCEDSCEDETVQLNECEKLYENATKQLESCETTYNNEMKQLENCQKSYEEAQKNYNSQLTKYNSMKSDLSKYSSLVAAHNTADQDYAVKFAAYTVAKANYNPDSEEYKAAKDDYTQKLAKYNSQVAIQEYLLAHYDEYLNIYNEYKSTIAKTKSEIAAALNLEVTVNARNMRVTIDNSYSLHTQNDTASLKISLSDKNLSSQTYSVSTIKPEISLTKYDNLTKNIQRSEYTNKSRIDASILNGVRALSGTVNYKTEVIIGGKTDKVRDTAYYSDKVFDVSVGKELTKTYKVDVKAPTVTEKYEEVLPVNVYTPITVNASVEVDKNQVIDQTSSEHTTPLIQINTPFTIKITNDRSESVYGFGDTDKFNNGYYIKFDFDVHKVKIDGKSYKNGERIPAGTWIGFLEGDDVNVTVQAYGNVEDNSLSIVSDEKSSYTVRAVAYNATKLMRDTSKLYPTLEDWENSDAASLVANICSTPSYFAEQTNDVIIINRMYGFRITDVKDVEWKDVFRITSGSSVNKHTGNLYYAGILKWETNSTSKVNKIANRTASEIGRNPLRILPLGPYKNVDITKIKAPKIGYRFSYDLKVTGSYYTSTGEIKTDKKVNIKTKFYYISKDGKTFIEESSGKAGIYLFYKNSSGQYVRIDNNGGNYELKYTPLDGYRYITDSTTDTLAKTPVSLGNLRNITIKYNMATPTNNRAAITYYGEYKLPNSTIAVKVDANGKYDINKPLTDGYIGVIFDITANAGTITENEVTSPVVLRYGQNTSDKANTSQWDYEGFLGFTNYGNTVKTGEVSMKLEKGTWQITNDIYNKIKGTVILYDMDQRAATDFE